jgi:hypothetical protein
VISVDDRDRALGEIVELALELREIMIVDPVRFEDDLAHRLARS